MVLGISECLALAALYIRFKVDSSKTKVILPSAKRCKGSMCLKAFRQLQFPQRKPRPSRKLTSRYAFPIYHKISSTNPYLIGCLELFRHLLSCIPFARFCFTAVKTKKLTTAGEHVEDDLVRLYLTSEKHVEVISGYFTAGVFRNRQTDP